jgi:hypothetical protein
MFNYLSTAILMGGTLAISGEPGNCRDDEYGNFLAEECYCDAGEVINEDFSGCVPAFEEEDDLSFSESDSEWGEGRRLHHDDHHDEPDLNTAPTQAYNHKAMLDAKTKSKLATIVSKFNRVKRLGLSHETLRGVAH